MPSQTVLKTEQKSLATEIHQSLFQWWQASAVELYAYSADELVYGTGYNTWGVQTQQKAIAVAATLALSGDQHALDQCMRMLRFNLNSHLTGSHACLDGQQWGNTWISVLGIERMMFAIEDLLERDLLPQDIVVGLRRVLVSEAAFLLNEYDIVAGLVENNKPESNIWNGAFLWRVSLLYPDLENVQVMKDKAELFLLNGISTESDLRDTNVCDKIVGANFFDSMSLNHHGYLNVGYMVICLSNIAMLHFTCKRMGKAAPEALYHHAYDLWQLILLCTCADGRLWRVGGDTRVRYCYCQDYVLPMWAFIEDYFHEDCSDLKRAWCKQIYKEQEHNKDQTYLSDRLRSMRDISQQYYTRLESDRASALAMYAQWEQQIQACDKTYVRAFDAWQDDYHGSSVQRSAHRLVSWTWRGGEGPCGTCVPSSRSDMLEWGNNLFPQIRAFGDRQDYLLGENKQQLFPGGFVNIGRCRIKEHGYLTEGNAEGLDLADVYVCCVALPDQKSTLIVQYATALNVHRLRSVAGLHLQIPNDIWNNFERQYAFKDQRLGIHGCDDVDKDYCDLGRRVLVDNAMHIQSIYQQSEFSDHQDFSLKHHGQRSIGLKENAHTQRAGGFLAVDELHLPFIGESALKRVAIDATLVDTACIISTVLDEQITAQVLVNDGAYKQLELQIGKKRYLCVINFAETARSAVAHEGKLLTESEPGAGLSCAVLECA